jgi:hypothetical protein
VSLRPRLIDAPLEKLLQDDLSAEAFDLFHKLELATVYPSQQEIAAMVRTVSVGLDIPPPTGTALKLYLKLLAEVPLTVLMAAGERLIKTHRYATFPKPVDWLSSASNDQDEIEKARFTMNIYERRLKMAQLYYGPRKG